MEQKFYEVLLNETTIKDSTRSVYIRHLERLCHEVLPTRVNGSVRVPTLTDVIEDPGLVERALRGMGSHAQDLYVASVIALLYHTDLRKKRPELYTAWCDLKRKIRQPIERKYLSNAPDERQEAAWVTFEDLLRARAAADLDSRSGTQDALLLWMYTSIPPVRGDYYNCKVVHVHTEKDAALAVAAAKDGGYNAFILGARRVPSRTVLTDYKTSQTYGCIVTPVPPELAAAVRRSLRAFSRDTLFVDSRGQGYSGRNSFTKWANRVLRRSLENERVSLTTLRHIFISRRDLALETKTGAERAEVARAMGHGNATQDRYNFRR